MSRQEQDREDLLREATALIERVELATNDCDEAIVAGFRRTGALSFYFGADPVFQFNADRELRRCFFEGRLVKAEEGKLFWLDRIRSADESILKRSPLDENETYSLIEQVSTRLAQLRAALTSGRYKLIGQVPESADVIGRIVSWIDDAPNPAVIATSPRVGG